MENHDFANLGQAVENQDTAAKLITEIRHHIPDTVKADYATHYLIGIVFGGSRWGKEIPGKVLIELQELCDKVREKGFPELEDKYLTHFKGKRWVPLWYVNFHFHQQFRQLLENRFIDSVVRENTMEDKAHRPVMGYVSDPLTSVSPEKVAKIHSELVSEANRSRHPNPEVSKMGVQGRNNGDEIMDLIELIRQTEGNGSGDEKLFTLNHYIVEGLKLFKEHSDVHDDVIDEVTHCLEDSDHMVLISINSGEKSIWTDMD